MWTQRRLVSMSLWSYSKVSHARQLCRVKRHNKPRSFLLREVENLPEFGWVQAMQQVRPFRVRPGIVFVGSVCWVLAAGVKSRLFAVFAFSSFYPSYCSRGRDRTGLQTKRYILSTLEEDQRTSLDGSNSCGNLLGLIPTTLRVALRCTSPGPLHN